MKELTTHQAAPDADWRVVIDASQRRKLVSLSELWEFRDLLMLLVKRDISVRYRQTALGVLWAVLQPLGMVAIFSIVFGRLARMPSDGVPYALYAFAGLLPWQFFSLAITSASMSVVNSRNLVTKVYFPRLIVPVAAIGAPMLDLLVATGIMTVMTLWYGRSLPGDLIILLPLFYLLTALTAIGVGSFIAALNVAYRDFRNMMPFLTSAWMFATPVIYPPSIIPEKYASWIYLNPMAGIISGIRSAWFDLPFNYGGMALSAAVSLLMLSVGMSYFRATERRIADIV